MITRQAYAKINLALAVGPPLPAGDPRAGMHPIASWMHAIDLYDQVELTPGGSGLSVQWAADAPRPSPVDWPPERDLAARAVKLLEREAGQRLDASIRIVKRIPVSGGLGGGSSDGAAAMIAANEAFGLGLGLDRLAALSHELGSDVAFFLDRERPRPALVKGLGDRIERLDARGEWLVLVLPRFGCATGAVYKAFDGLGPVGLRDAGVERAARAAELEGSALFNDLLAAAEVVRPELRTLRQRLAQAVAGSVHMSGSGSTLFIVAQDRPQAGGIAESVRRAGEIAVVTRLV